MSAVAENSTGYVSLTATAVAIGLGVRVKIDSSGNISAAGATDHWIGVTTSPVAASGVGTVKLRGAPGTFLVQVAGAVAIGARLYPAASGKFDDVQSAGAESGLIAKSASGADGDIIEAIPASNTPQVVVLPFYVPLAAITGAQDVVTAFPLTFAGTITAFDFVVARPVTTAAKLATLNIEIGETDLTGGAIALTSAAATPMGKVISSTAITAGNTFAAGDTLSIEASSVTAFSEGDGTLLVTCVKN